MKAIILLLVLSCLAISQEYLPKEGELLINDLLSNNIARAGDNDFWKVDTDGWSTLISAYPVRPDAVTKVTFYLVFGNDWIIGCGKGGDLSRISNN